MALSAPVLAEKEPAAAPATRPALPKVDRNLLNAIDAGDVESVKKLLAGGSPVNTEGDSPLCRAVGMKKIEIAIILLAHGANVDSANNWGCTSLYFAAWHGDEVMAKLLLDAGATKQREDALRIAATNGHAETVRLFIARGASVNATSRNGRTALFSAASKGRADVVKILLEAGADPAITDHRGKTPADEARVQTYPEIAKMIEEFKTPKSEKK